MSNVNQGTRAGNLLGRLSGEGFAGNDWNDVVLKPGYIIKIRDRFALVEAVEGLSVDLYFNDSITVTGDGAGLGLDSSAEDESDKVAAYGDHTMNALLGVGTSTVSTPYRTTVLSPDYDSGYTVFKDLEPFKGHIYHLCPSLPVQPKYITQEGNTVTRDGILPSSTSDNTGIPVGFPGAITTGGGGTSDPDAGYAPIGSVSSKIYLKHPAGVPKYVLDESPEGSSGATTSGNILGLSGFIDGQISPVEDPDWSYSVWIEHGENNLPAFRMVNDSEEYLLDGRMRLQGWKYRIVELTMGQLRTIRERSGGRLTFKVINPAGLPTAGTMLSEYFPQ
ncbi:MAG: hypothetical protein CMP53_09430 [Flavobacteriales bacterium]|nr:hypothetical protein [Flavobacteriales bacterium]